MIRKICLISDHHLSINPRLWKEAFVYEKMGFDVVVITQWISDFFLEKDLELLKNKSIKYEAYIDLRPSNSSFAKRFVFRARKRLGSELVKIFNIHNSWAISFAIEKLFARALKENADYYSAHLEAGFIAGCKLIHAGKKVGFDLEDWYSRDYLMPDRAVKLLHKTEGRAFMNGVFFSTTSHALSNAFQKEWKSKKNITVIYNSFPDSGSNSSQYEIQSTNKLFRLVWTSRTIGPGRGLEPLVYALSLLNIPVELHIIGQIAPGFEQVLKRSWPNSKRHQLIIHDFVRHDDLHAILSQCDLGIALENTIPDSRDKTITNKILQYIQAGIRVLATNTEGQVEVASYFPESVYIVPIESPEKWHLTLEEIILNKDILYKDQQRHTYEKIFSWNSQEEKIKWNINSLNQSS